MTFPRLALLPLTLLPLTLLPLTLYTTASPALAASLVVDNGHAIQKVIAVQPFTLTTPYAYEWTASHFQVKSGTILVLDSDPIWLIPSDSKQAVLYVGDTPCERLNAGFPDGRLVVVVPSGPDLSRVPIYYGGYELPENVTSTSGAATLAQARKQGLQPLPQPFPLPFVLAADHAELVKLALTVK